VSIAGVPDLMLTHGSGTSDLEIDSRDAPSPSCQGTAQLSCFDTCIPTQLDSLESPQPLDGAGISRPAGVQADQ